MVVVSNSSRPVSVRVLTSVHVMCAGAHCLMLSTRRFTPQTNTYTSSSPKYDSSITSPLYHHAPILTNILRHLVFISSYIFKIFFHFAFTHTFPALHCRLLLLVDYLLIFLFIITVYHSLGRTVHLILGN